MHDAILQIDFLKAFFNPKYPFSQDLQIMLLNYIVHTIQHISSYLHPVVSL